MARRKNVHLRVGHGPRENPLHRQLFVVSLFILLAFKTLPQDMEEWAILLDYFFCS